MTRIRKFLILTHRYLGIVLSLFFVMWFVSGIGIMYSKGMPRLTPQLRLERLVPLNFEQIKVTVSEAARLAGLEDQPPGRVTLLTVMDRPAYRVGGGGAATTVFADNGELLKEVGEAEALKIAARFTGLSEDRFHYSLQTEVDEWTIEQRSQLPLHKIRVDDAGRTELLILREGGDIAVLTTRGTRALAWVAAIPHWMYFTKLRVRGELWTNVVLWTSGIGCVLALLGIILGFTQLKYVRPFRVSKISSYIPYSGWMRWHYITGFIFGIFTLTWVFSGLLSMQPGNWAGRGGLSDDVRSAFTGGPLDLARYPAMDPAAWKELLDGGSAKEVDFVRIQGDPYYVVRGSDSGRTLVAAGALQVRREPFSVESLMSRIRETYAGVPIVETELLSDYDSYYYDQDRTAPLPILRVKFGDPDRTWFYVDPAMNQLLVGFTRLGRLERWIYHGFHSLDFSFWYYNRSVWEIGIIVLSLGGLATSTIGLYLGFRRVLRAVKPASAK